MLWFDNEFKVLDAKNMQQKRDRNDCPACKTLLGLVLGFKGTREHGPFSLFEQGTQIGLRKQGTMLH